MLLLVALACYSPHLCALLSWLCHLSSAERAAMFAAHTKQTSILGQLHLHTSPKSSLLYHVHYMLNFVCIAL